MNKLHTIESIKFESGLIILTVDGQTLSRKISDVSTRLSAASETARNHFEISPSGYGIHWPDCDEDLSVDALLGIQHKTPMIAAKEGVEYKTR
ncbi:MAG: DUF2442 domain-containing protein [Kiritimatiellaeota bacterium]|nr:DUF2442 domain-containing protein [Kiritimatiellota bacterium]